MWMTINDYAKHKNLGPHTIRKHIRRGRIPKSALKPKKPGGSHLLVHRDKADKALIGVVREVTKKVTKKTRKPKPKPKKQKPVEPSDTEKQEVIDSAGIKEFENISEAQKFKETYLGALRKLEYEEKSGQQISKAEVERDAFNTGRTVRDSLLNISGRISAILAAESDEDKVSEILTKEIRQALEVLSR